MSKSTESPAFRLEDQTSRWGGTGATKIWSLTLDLPGEKVNKLSQKVMEEFQTVLTQLEILGAENKIDALILLSGKVGNFIAGADIEMIQAAPTAKDAEELSRQGQKLLDRWEDLPFPTIAAIHGAALGGGCEFALGSSAIVMSNASAAKIGLPEVLLGLIPGMGGTIRLPRKVGLATALDMILTGKTLNGQRAVKAGLVEACLPQENFHDSAARWTLKNWADIKAGKRLAKVPPLGGMGGPIGGLLEKTPMKAVIFKKAREGVLSKTHGHYPAPLEAIEVIQSTGGSYSEKIRGSARDQAMAREAKGFGKVAASEVSKNLIRLFYLTETVKKSKGLPFGTSVVEKPVHSSAVLGAGVMGGGIAQLLADKTIPTRMKDLNTKALALGVSSASKVFQKKVQRKRMTQREFLQKLNLIAPVADYSGFHKTDIVIEAIIENLEIKKKVFQELEAQIAEDCIVVSNTSSLSISKMQSAFKIPERFAGMHFFNPVHKMPLIEVIRGEKTSDTAIATVFQLSKALGKTPIVVKDSPGFLVNRILGPYMSEAIYLLEAGVPITEIDQALLKFGMPMGPMELIDEVGVDVADKVAHTFHEAFGERMRPATLASKVIAAGRLGKKNGKGIYAYEGPKNSKVLDPKIYEMLEIKPASNRVTSEEIVERCVLPMINEACRCLDEGVVGSPSDVDLGMIMGTGFPPFRGGLLRYADSLGMRKIHDGLKKYESQLGVRFQPSEGILQRAEHDKKFY